MVTPHSGVTTLLLESGYTGVHHMAEGVRQSLMSGVVFPALGSDAVVHVSA